MTQLRVNKHGIRILDEPKSRIEKRVCLPDEHVWRRTGKSRPSAGGLVGVPIEYETRCQGCLDTDWEPS